MPWCGNRNLSFFLEEAIKGGAWIFIKLPLHPIERVHTCKCATNIVEKYERSLVVGWQRFVCTNKVYSPNKSVTT